MTDDIMLQRVYAVGICACLAVTSLLTATTATAQLPTTIKFTDSKVESTKINVESPRATNAVSDLLQRGRSLEQQRRWSEALAHYEEAVREYPQDAVLRERFEISRLHYDLQRRYADRSFRESVSRLTFQQALDLYAQVLLKVETHYVEPPRWKDLVDRGTSNLEMAIGEPTFMDPNIPLRARPSIDAFRDELRSMVGSQTVGSREAAREIVASAARLANERLEISPTVAVLEYLCGATGSLDPYSTYLTPDQLNEVYAQIEGNFVGLGVELKAQENVLVIVRTISGSPAEQAGIRAGDRILSVDGRATSTLTTDQAANMLQGVEGSVVRLVLAAPGQQSRTLDVRRRAFDVPSVDHVKIIDQQYGIGYLRLTCFQKTTARELDAALWKLHRDGMRSLVIDERGNPGGLLVASVEAADRFIERGVIVSTRGRSTQEDLTYTAHEQGKWRLPMVVIIDQDSASAAEIFAGAIHEHHRGTIVGVRSFGKGSVQGIFPLDEFNSGVRLTTAKFYSPTGKPYSHVGVEPDVVVQPVRTVAKPINGVMPAAEDAMLNVASQTARDLEQTLQARNSQ